LVLSILLTLRRPPSPSLFPYTTLFRSRPARVRMDSSGIHLPQRPNLVPVAAAGQRLRQRHVGDTVVRIYRCVGRVAVGAGLQPAGIPGTDLPRTEAVATRSGMGNASCTPIA